jgi:hypothetical protein
MTRHRMTNGIATFNNVQILDMAKTKVETIVENGVHVPLHLGKNAKWFFKNNKKVDHSPEVSTTKTGDYFYLYTMPLTNYYHMLLDGIGCLARYFELLESNPNIKLLLNQSPRAKGGVVNHPPFVTELLDLLGIDWEYTDEHCIYERVYFGDTLGQTSAGKRIRPDNRQYLLLKQCIQRAKLVAQAPKYEKIYLSRRAHANPLNDRKAVIGEDNTVKRGLTNEDSVVEILTDLGYAEVFGENYSLAEKIVLFNGMSKYISTAGAGVANMLWTMPNSCSVGGIHSPGFPFPGDGHKSHICCNKEFINATINNYPGKVLFVDPAAGAQNYNSPWYINNLDAFKKWASRI